jgi:hypothetical protein
MVKAGPGGVHQIGDGLRKRSAGLFYPLASENFTPDGARKITAAYDRRTIRRHPATLEARFDPRKWLILLENNDLQDRSKLFVEVAGRAGDVNASGNSAFPILYSFHNASCFIAFGTFNALGSVHHLGTIGGLGYFRHGVISSSTGFAAGTQFFSNLVPAWNAFGGTNRRALLVSMLHDPVRIESHGGLLFAWSAGMELDARPPWLKP